MLNFLENVEIIGLTNLGQKRTNNEDSFGIDSATGLLIVADGMGGHDAGEIASQMAVEGTARELAAHPKFQSNPGPLEGKDEDTTIIDKSSIISDVVNNTCAAINALNVERDYRDGKGMGTTIVGLWCIPDTPHIAIFHVGDSRVYRWREKKLSPMTQDHTAHRDWLNNGSDGPEPRKNIISRALGPWPETKVDVRMEMQKQGDVYLLCSDGLCGMITDTEIETIISNSEDIESGANALVQSANDHGGKDNITVVLAKF